MTCVENQVHYHFVDRANVLGYESNLAWPEGVHMAVVQFNAAGIPHIYRFLPNGIVLWMQICRIRFNTARYISRQVDSPRNFASSEGIARLGCPGGSEQRMDEYPVQKVQSPLVSGNLCLEEQVSDSINVRTHA